MIYQFYPGPKPIAFLLSGCLYGWT